LVLSVGASLAANPVAYKGMAWQVGQWAQYDMKMDNKSMSVKYAITGTETVNGKTWYWFENEMNMPEGKAISKILILPGESKPKKFIMKTGDRPAMDMTSLLESQPQRQQNTPIQRDEEIIKGFVGNENITVPAGLFNTVHSRVQNQASTDKSDVWVSAKVPITGLVQLTGKSHNEGKTELKLVKYGLSGAQTAITEKPQAFTMPTMPNMNRSPKALPKLDNK
jgi:hypothetical protein